MSESNGGTPPVTESKTSSPINSSDKSNSAPNSSHEPQVNWPVFLVSGIGVIAIALWAIILPDNAAETLGTIVSWVATNLGWFYILTATVAVIFMLSIAASRAGVIKLGPDHSKPQYSLFSWSAMLFAAGIGVDLLFFSVAEPVAQYYGPPTGDGESVEAARQAVVFTLFHYGITGWALYALMGMAFGYFAYRLHMPLTIRSALYPLIGKRIHGPAGDAVDIAAMLGTVFGIAASLGIGVVQLNYGLTVLFGAEESTFWQVALIILAVGVATISAVSGVDKGIRRLSEGNVILAICLMLYILVTGRTSFLFNALVMNTGEYISRFPSMTMDTYAFSDAQEWLNGWTLFFWAWWIAWAPFVGLFLARISRGRSLRQFVIGTLSIPFLFILLWVSVFGNSALDVVLKGNDNFGETAVNQPERAFYMLLENYPGSVAVMAIASLIGLLLYITSADSGALVMSNFTSRIEDANQDGKSWLRIFWAVAVGLLTIGMLIVGGITTLQNATIVMGLPFSIVIYLIMYSLFTSLRLELLHSKTGSLTIHNALTGRTGDPSGNWQQRVRRAMSFPTQKDTKRYIDSVAAPALKTVAEEIEKNGADVTFGRSVVEEYDIDQLELNVNFGGERNFRYQVYPVGQPTPSFAGRVTLDKKSDSRYFRLEVFSLTGSLGYDVYGYTKEQLIENVLDLYEHHLEFLHAQADLPGSSDYSDNAEPVTDWLDDHAKE